MTETAGGVQGDDNAYFHEAALNRGFSCVVLPNGVLIVHDPDTDREICLAHGVVPETKQANAALIEEQDVVRQILADCGLPTPDTRVYWFVDDLTAVSKAVSKAGYPRFVRAPWGSRQRAAGSRVLRVESKSELLAAIDSIRNLVGARAVRPGKSRGRFMVEEIVSETELNALVLGGDIVSAVLASADDSDVVSPRAIPIADVHADLLSLVQRAASVLPDMPLATVRVAVSDPTASLNGQRHAVVGLDTHARFAVHEAARRGAGLEIAGLIIDQQAERAGLTPQPAQQSVTVRVRADGVAHPKRAAKALAEGTANLGFDGTVTNGDREVQLDVSGPANDIAAFGNRVISGEIRHLRPLFVEEHVIRP